MYDFVMTPPAFARFESDLSLWHRSRCTNMVCLWREEENYSNVVLVLKPVSHLLFRDTDW